MISSDVQSQTSPGDFLANYVQSQQGLPISDAGSFTAASSNQTVTDAAAYDPNTGNETLDTVQTMSASGTSEGLVQVDFGSGNSPIAAVIVTAANGAAQSYSLSGTPMVQLGVNGSITATGSESTILIGEDGSILNNGSGQALDIALGSSVSVIGGRGSAQADLLGTGEYVDLSGATVTLDTGASTNLVGSDDVVSGGGTSVGALSGSYDTVMVGNGGYVGSVLPAATANLPATGLAVAA